MIGSKEKTAITYKKHNGFIHILVFARMEIERAIALAKEYGVEKDQILDVCDINMPNYHCAKFATE